MPEITIDLTPQTHFDGTQYGFVLDKNSIPWDVACQIVGIKTRQSRSTYRKWLGVEPDQTLDLKQFEMLSLMHQFCQRRGNYFSRANFLALVTALGGEAKGLGIDSKQYVKQVFRNKWGIQPHELPALTTQEYPHD